MQQKCLKFNKVKDNNKQKKRILPSAPEKRLRLPKNKNIVPRVQRQINTKAQKRQQYESFAKHKKSNKSNKEKDN